MTRNITPRPIELLAPARDAATAIEAIKCGADAVYIGANKFGARAMAGNSLDDLATLTEFAHLFGARVYATVNTIIFDHELKEVEALVRRLYSHRVDALIVQDTAMLRLDLPPIALHSSTQCDLRTPEKARFLEDVGFSQLVMARELTHQEICDIRQATTVPLEAFVHGALCVSYSGRCQISQALKGRSANRGQCAQICRLPFDLVDAQGRALMRGKHLLSLKDFNQIDRLQQLLDCGVSSLKIEGRLKDKNYVRNVTAAYRQRLDKIIETNSELYCRASKGRTEVDFAPDCAKSFNRQFTHYFFDVRRPADAHSMASIHTPKSFGEHLGSVVSVHGKVVNVNTSKPISNGDGLSALSADGEYTGFRVNRAQGNRLFAASTVDVARGAELFRTADKAFDDSLEKSQTTRTIALEAHLRVCPPTTVALDLADELGNYITHTIQVDCLQKAERNQSAKQIETLGKLGNTHYRLEKCEAAGEWFVPMSALAQLKREALQLLATATHIHHPLPLRGKENLEAKYPQSELVATDNVANALAAEFYHSHGVVRMAKATEVLKPAATDKNVPLMTTRYCLRRELGACLKGKTPNALPAQLFLVTGSTRLRIECRCDACEMFLYKG